MRRGLPPLPSVVVASHPPSQNCHCKKRKKKKRLKKKVKLIHFNISCLDALPSLRGHVSQKAFTGFPITVEKKTGDGNKSV